MHSSFRKSSFLATRSWKKARLFWEKTWQSWERKVSSYTWCKRDPTPAPTGLISNFCPSAPDPNYRTTQIQTQMEPLTFDLTLRKPGDPYWRPFLAFHIACSDASQWNFYRLHECRQRCPHDFQVCQSLAFRKWSYLRICRTFGWRCASFVR